MLKPSLPKDKNIRLREGKYVFLRVLLAGVMIALFIFLFFGAGPRLLLDAGLSATAGGIILAAAFLVSITLWLAGEQFLFMKVGPGKDSGLSFSQIVELFSAQQKRDKQKEAENPFKWFLALIGLGIALQGFVQTPAELLPRQQMPLPDALLAQYVLPADDKSLQGFVQWAATRNAINEDDAQAVAFLSRILEQSPTAQIYYYRGARYLHTAQWDEGIEDMVQVLARSTDPNLRAEAEWEIFFARVTPPLGVVHYFAAGIFAVLTVLDFLGTSFEGLPGKMRKVLQWVAPGCLVVYAITLCFFLIY